MHLGLFELLHNSGQKPKLPYPFQVFNATHVNKPQYRELWAFNEFAIEKSWNSYDLSGVLSPRFLEKMGISVQQLLTFIHSNPENDLYLFHPYPREISLSNNFLELAELEHPGITAELAFVWREIFSTDLPVIDMPADTSLCCHCNYFIGSKRFWQGYSEFVSGFMKLVSSNRRASLHSATPYSLSRTNDRELPLAVFTFERSLTHYIKSQKNGLTTINFSTAHQSTWSAPEIFPGEAKLVASLLERIPIQSRDIDAIKSRKNTALHAYYYFRKLWSEF